MTVESPGKGPNMTQRAVMQHLSLADWKLAHRLPMPAGEMMLGRMAQLGWIELRGEDHLKEIRLTEAGLGKMRSRI